MAIIGNALKSGKFSNRVLFIGRGLNQLPYKDPIKQKEAQRNHYIKNKKDYLTRSTQRRLALKEWFKEINAKIKCVYCSEDELICIDWHHKDPLQKDAEVSRLVNELRSKERILNEIKKCVPLCSNCHRKVHAGLLEKKW